MQAFMADQMRSNPTSNSALDMWTVSLARFIAAMLRPEALPISSISFAVENG